MGGRRPDYAGARFRGSRSRVRQRGDRRERHHADRGGGAHTAGGLRHRGATDALRLRSRSHHAPAGSRHRRWPRLHGARRPGGFLEGQARPRRLRQRVPDERQPCFRGAVLPIPRHVCGRRERVGSDGSRHRHAGTDRQEDRAERRRVEDRCAVECEHGAHPRRAGRPAAIDPAERVHQREQAAGVAERHPDRHLRHRRRLRQQRSEPRQLRGGWLVQHARRHDRRLLRAWVPRGARSRHAGGVAPTSAPSRSTPRSSRATASARR